VFQFHGRFLRVRGLSLSTPFSSLSFLLSAAAAASRYEAARDKVAAFVGASRREEIVFTRGATEAINLVANTWAAAHLGPGDEVILSVAEHHSNLVPWQLLASRQGVLLQFVQLDGQQRYDLAHFQSLLSPRTKLVALQHVSNVLGAVNPVEEVHARWRHHTERAPNLSWL
jgi:cysteine desulfurase/selenocysteine lyase